MNFIKSSVLTLASTAIACLSMAQTNFQPGYIINHQRDTIRGEINYQDWSINPSEITFKSNDQEQVYGALDIYAFGVNSEYYEGATVDVELSSANAKNLTYGAELDLEETTIFLQAKVLGPKSLYMVINRNLVTNFYVKVDGQFRLLRYKKYLVNKDGVSMQSELRLYQGVLGAYLGDCEFVKNSTSRVTYDEQQLGRLFIKYYGCVDEVPVYQKPTEKIKLRFGALGGISYTSLNLSSKVYIDVTGVRVTPFEYLVNASWTSSVGPAFGFFIRYDLPKSQNKWSLINEWMVTSFKSSGYHTSTAPISDGTVTREYLVDFGQTTLKSNLIARYNAASSVPDRGMFANFGGSVGFALSETHDKLFRTQRNNDPVQEDQYPGDVFETATVELSLIAGLGYRYQHWGVEGRYELCSNIAFDNEGAQHELFAIPTRLHLLFSYTF